MMDQAIRVFAVFMMCRRMKQHIKTGPLSGGNRNDRNPQHFREPVRVDLHAPLFHNVHHVQRQYNRLAKFQKLQGQIQIALKCGGIRNINNYIDFIAEYELSGNLLLHRIRSQAVSTGKVNQANGHIMVLDGTFHLFNGDSRPVCHF